MARLAPTLPTWRGEVRERAARTSHEPRITALLPRRQAAEARRRQASRLQGRMFEARENAWKGVFLNPETGITTFTESRFGSRPGIPHNSPQFVGIIRIRAFRQSNAPAHCGNLAVRGKSPVEGAAGSCGCSARREEDGDPGDLLRRTRALRQPAYRLHGCIASPRNLPWPAGNARWRGEGPTGQESRIKAFNLHFSPRGEVKWVRGPSGRGASRLARAGVLEQYVEHGKQAQRSPGGRIACFDRRVVRNAG